MTKPNPSLLAAVLMAVLLFTTLARAGGGLIEPELVLLQSKADKIMIIDVRTPREWARTGVPLGAKGATIVAQGANQAFLARIKVLTKGNKLAPIAMICAVGIRSARATQLLRLHGYANVHDIKGGMFGNGQSVGWLRLKLPVSKVSP